MDAGNISLVVHMEWNGNTHIESEQVGARVGERMRAIAIRIWGKSSRQKIKRKKQKYLYIQGKFYHPHIPTDGPTDNQDNWTELNRTEQQQCHIYRSTWVYTYIYI